METAIAKISSAEHTIPHFRRYDVVLKKHGVQFKERDRWLMVGKEMYDGNWILFISCQTIQMFKLLDAVLPILKQHKVHFKVINGEFEHYHLNADANGYANAGKPLVVYTQSLKQAQQLIAEIDAVTKGFSGVRVPGCLRVGNIIYTAKAIPEEGQTAKNGSLYISGKGNTPFQEKYKDFDLVPERKYQQKRYVIISELRRLRGGIGNVFVPFPVTHPDCLPPKMKGRIYRAIDMWRIKEVIIKKGHQNALDDHQGRTIQTRMQWQWELHQRLAGTIQIPKARSFYHKNGDSYLVLDEVDGTLYTAVVSSAIGNQSWKELKADMRKWLLEQYLKVAKVVSDLHGQNIVHRDLTDSNVKITKSGKAYIYDLEISFDRAKEKPFPAFVMGTNGYVAPEQERGAYPDYPEDIYSLGSLWSYTVTGIPPWDFIEKNPQKTKMKLMDKVGDPAIVEMIMRCLLVNPHARPKLAELITSIESIIITIQT